MKLQRWRLMFNNGAWCKSDDVARLEASHAELLAVAKDVLDWRQGVFSAIHPRASFLFDRVRAAIAQAEGEGI